MTLSLGDAFSRRKKLAADLQTWIQRLQQSGADVRKYRTRAVEGSNAFVPEPGTEKLTRRHYTIAECRQRIAEILAEDRNIAQRISLTNRVARAKVVDLDSLERELTVPELLVLKDDVIPKLEQVARAVPTRSEDVSLFEEGPSHVRHRSIKKVEKKRETLTEKGHKVEEVETIGYDVVETTDYGIAQRDAWNEIDRIQDFAERVKAAINECNKTPLVEL
jgi:hypothetical protein